VGFWVGKCTTGQKLADAYTGWGKTLSRVFVEEVAKSPTVNTSLHGRLWKPLRALIWSEKRPVAATNISKPAKVHTNKFKSHHVMFKQ